MNMKKICVAGLGYIGLPTAIIAAQSGFEVVGYDCDQSRVTRINQADPVIHEPEVKEKLQAVLAKNLFRAFTHIQEADCFIIAVPTPCTDEKKADISYVLDVANAISTVIKKNNAVLIESTIPVGVTMQVAHCIAEKSGLSLDDFSCAYCPERVLPGKIFYELIHNTRVIGGVTASAAVHASKFYKTFVQGQIFCTTAQTAELVKLVENSARDVQIAFANEVALIADSCGVDPYEVIELANKHPRISLLQPRCGVGGHCIAIDPWFIVEGFNEQARLIRAARTINDARPLHVFEKIKNVCEAWAIQHNKPCKIFLLGAAYKPDVDDLRESPAVQIARYCAQNKHMDVRVCDPYITVEKAQQFMLPQLIDFDSGYVWADVIICLVGHSAFMQRKPLLLQNEKRCLDFCGLLFDTREHGYQVHENNFLPAQMASSNDSAQTYATTKATSEPNVLEPSISEPSTLEPSAMGTNTVERNIS